MARITLEQHWNLLEIERKYHTKFGRRKGSTVPGIRRFIAKVRETDSIVDAKRRARTVSTTEHIETVTESVRKYPSTSIHHRSHEMNI